MEANLRVEANIANIIIGLNKFKLERRPCLLWATTDGVSEHKTILPVYLHEVNGKELSVTFSEQISAKVLQSLIESKSYFCTQEKDFSFKIDFDRIGQNQLYFRLPSKALMPERRKGLRYSFHHQDLNLVYLTDSAKKITSYRACDISKGGVGIVMSERESHEFIKRGNVKITALPFVKKGIEMEYEIGRVESYRKKKFNSDELVKVVLKFKTVLSELNIPKKNLENSSSEHLKKVSRHDLLKEIPSSLLSLIRFRHEKCLAKKDVASESIAKNIQRLQNFMEDLDESTVATLNKFGARKIAPSLNIMDEELLINFLSYLSLENRKLCYETLPKDQSLIHTQRAQEELLKYFEVKSAEKIYSLKAA